jgi:hypothetical protein
MTGNRLSTNCSHAQHPQSSARRAAEGLRKSLVPGRRCIWRRLVLPFRAWPEKVRGSIQMVAPPSFRQEIPHASILSSLVCCLYSCVGTVFCTSSAGILIISRTHFFDSALLLFWSIGRHLNTISPFGPQYNIACPYVHNGDIDFTSQSCQDAPPNPILEYPPRPIPARTWSSNVGERHLCRHSTSPWPHQGVS